MAMRSSAEKKRDEALGVRVEARYTVGEYDILILGAKQSEGLETWLRENGYRIPAKAAAALQPYIRQDMKFFVAKVNLEAQKASGVQYLRPLQIAYESKKFMLPIRLGMANAAGPQDMIVYALTRRGRVESVNYRTTRDPLRRERPAVREERLREVLPGRLRPLGGEGGPPGGVHRVRLGHGLVRPVRRAARCPGRSCGSWASSGSTTRARVGLDRPGVPPSAPVGGPVNVLLTRLHVRYDGAHFPEDLVFQETSDRSNFQARYILQHPYQGASECSAMDDYRERLRERRSKEAETLASLTGWSMEDIRSKMGPDGADVKNPRPWYRRLWTRVTQRSASRRADSSKPRSGARIVPSPRSGAAADRPAATWKSAEAAQAQRTAGGARCGRAATWPAPTVLVANGAASDAHRGPDRVQDARPRCQPRGIDYSGKSPCDLPR